MRPSPPTTFTGGGGATAAPASALSARVLSLPYCTTVLPPPSSPSFGLDLLEAEENASPLPFQSVIT